MRSTEHVGHVGEMTNGRPHLVDLGVDGMVIMKWF
jgi:hypothetical protein